MIIELFLLVTAIWFGLLLFLYAVDAILFAIDVFYNLVFAPMEDIYKCISNSMKSFLLWPFVFVSKIFVKCISSIIGVIN